jgi:hypothetical protein
MRERERDREGGRREREREEGGRERERDCFRISSLILLMSDKMKRV